MNFLLKPLILLFTCLFIYPAIIFSVLVLGLTSSWKSGIVMLSLALLLLIIVKICSINLPICRTSNRELRIPHDPPIHETHPPPLGDIYHEIMFQHHEQELFGKRIEQQTDSALDPNLPDRCLCCLDHECRRLAVKH
ncbi:hypothetical protein ACFOLF_25585 [Paenibacillus sepulcri]|uniref:Uncharacterized protein n=1 Tax=Paenibacillus sepulcri TaxID=359917 RepID=A0ABS7C3R4_9BACL|nr:hypothetical protein [Paenibacillus sepulcri]